MSEHRLTKIETLASDGLLTELRAFLGANFSQLEIDTGLSIAVAYSHIDTARHLLAIGADLNWADAQGAYYAAHNNELEGLRFAITNGVDVNVGDGSLLNTAVVTAYNEDDITIIHWLLENGADTSLLKKDIIESFGSPQIEKLIDSHSR